MRNKNFFLAVLVVMAFSACQIKEIKNIASPGETIICFGDSITVGEGARRGEDYPSRLSGYLDLPVINAGEGGDTSQGGLERLERDVLSRDPFLVIVELGGNDFFLKQPLENTLNNVGQIVDKITGYGAMVAIVDISPGVVLNEYHRAFAKLAREKSLIFLPGIFHGVMTDSRFKSDFLHPNREGYKLIAERIYRGIIPYIKRNKILRKAREE